VAAADLPLLLLTGCLGATGALLMSAAFRLAPAATLAPFDYSALVWAVLIGFFAFGDVPGPAILLGAALIVTSGLVLARNHH
jgi:S-adenosylmethionine uptake transporter